ncbi:MAG: EAL domain-containing protein [Deltaproteobacteria bacterium]|nr:EAL domain-containing protein [Deltaproteobacteria bacterium]
MLKRFSILQKTFLGVVIILIPILITFLITYNLIKEHLKKGVLNNITALAEVYEGQVYQFLDMTKGRALDFSSDGFIRESLQKIIDGQRNDKISAVEPLNEHLIKNKMSLDKTIYAIHVISLNGRITASTDKSAIGRDVSKEMFFINGKHVVSVAEIGANLAISAPLSNRTTGEPIGVLVNYMRLSELNKIMSGSFSKESGALSWDKNKHETLEAYLVDKNKLMITESRFVKDAAFKQAVDTAPVDACLRANEEMTSFYKDYRNVLVAGASMCIPSMKWTLLVEIDEDEAIRPVIETQRYVLYTTVFVALLVGVMVTVFFKDVIIRLRRVSAAARDIAKGDYNVTLPVGSSDEIGMLSESFNSMAKDIGARTLALQNSEASLANAQRIARLGNWDWDIIKNELRWSDEIYLIFGLSPQEFGATYEAFLNFIHPDDKEFVKESVNKALYEKKPYSIDHRIILPDGTERIVHEQAEVAFDKAGKPLKMLGTVQDVTENKHAEAELKKLSMIIENSINNIFITDIKGDIEYVNPMFEQITGWSKEEAVGKNPRILSSGETTRAEYEELWATITSGKTWRGSIKNKRKDNRPYWGNAVISPIKNEKGEITHFLAVQEDITEKKMAEERAQYLAAYDGLTGLLNRARFVELINKWMHSHADEQGILLLIDIDGFKFINDTYGHGVGDEMLRRAAVFLQNLFNEIGAPYIKESGEIILGRMGGDEFAVFLPYFNDGQGIEVSEQIRKRFEAVHFAEVPVHATISIGIVSYPAHGNTTKELFTKADAAIYRAKEMGRNRCHFYRAEDRDLENLHSRLKEKERIQKALADGRFLPWFQPILNLKDNKIHHYEALARMQGEDGKILFPSEFIDTAERFGFIDAIDRIIVEKTMKLQDEMKQQGKYISFGMNLSGKVLGDADFLFFLKAKMRETGADPNYLIFEITETAAVSNLDKAAKFISALKLTGCKFSLDDFGVGFTSFTYLKEMHIDYIKIDGSFIRRLHENPDDQHIVKSIIAVAKGMGIKTVAEFVEKEETIKLLKEYGVDYAQGYAIGKPGPKLLD